MLSSSLRVAARAIQQRVIEQQQKQSVKYFRYFSTAFLNEYDAHVAERAELGVVPKPLSPTQVQDLVSEITDGSVSVEDKETLKELLSQRVPPGVDEAAYVKATFLSSVRGCLGS